MKQLDHRMLHDLVNGERRAAGLHFVAEMEPLGGPGSPVAPAIFPPPKGTPKGAPQFEAGKRWDSHGNPCRFIVIDGVASQANRHEAALLEHLDDLGLPNVVLEFPDELTRTMPAHLPRAFNLLEFPHRTSDTYLLDAEFEGKPVHQSDQFNRLINATGTSAAPLLDMAPGSLVYGFWNSHAGKKLNQARLARSWTSRICGWHPLRGKVPRLAMKSDPAHLSADDHKVVVKSEADRFAGRSLEQVKQGKPKDTEKLSADGYGPVPSTSTEENPPQHPSFRYISREAVCSFAALRKIKLGDGYGPDHDAAAHTLLAALGVLAHRLSAEDAYFRSGCDLVTLHETVTLKGGPDNGSEVEIPDPRGLFDAALSAAKNAGVDLPSWGKTFRLTPSEYMHSVIAAAWPVEQ